MEQHERLVLHVDMDCFFAAVEQRDHPEFRGKPVIVGGLSSRGVVSTASYEARQYGVRSAMPMALAKRKCPAGIFLQGNYRQYGAVSAQIFEILSRFSPLIEPLSMHHLISLASQVGWRLRRSGKKAQTVHQNQAGGLFHLHPSAKA